MINNREKYVSVLSIITSVILMSLLFWIAFSFYQFYTAYSHPVQGISAETFIDKSGINEVELILNSRK